MFSQEWCGIFVLKRKKKKQEDVSKETVRISYVGYSGLNVDTLIDSGNYKAFFFALHCKIDSLLKINRTVYQA